MVTVRVNRFLLMHYSPITQHDVLLLEKRESNTGGLTGIRDKRVESDPREATTGYVLPRLESLVSELQVRGFSLFVSQFRKFVKSEN
ncbi:hypothetical protein BaRGS_00024896 [Batillaria attramentaria]|uniref:Uncharacterized protein n=1 Tax=Batillaria attramentaria TaxID=370345 RepID=A0ABD0K9S3_9CAEN